MLKLEIPMFLTRPLLTSLSVSYGSIEAGTLAYLLHLGPGGRDVLTEVEVEELLARLALDGVLLSGENTLWGVNLKVDLIGQT
jgi:hypothetical protein